MNETVIAFWNWTSISIEAEEPRESIEDIFSLDISVIIVLCVCLVSIVFCCVLQRYIITFFGWLYNHNENLRITFHS